MKCLNVAENSERQKKKKKKKKNPTHKPKTHRYQGLPYGDPTIEHLTGINK